MANKFFICLFLTIFALQSQNVLAIPTDTEYITPDKYFDTALNQINGAKSSIFLVMYVISIIPDQPESQPSRLVYALINAKNRGVNVKVILDQNINFESKSLDDAVLTNKNQKSYELLKKNNVAVFFDESQTFAHGKALVIDNKTVLLGSSNWSKSALTRNYETNVLIHSEALAHEVVKNLNQIKLQENIPAILTPSISIPKSFLIDKKLLGEMASSSDERAFDTYLYFLKEFDQNKESAITLDYDNLAKSLKIDHMTPEDYRRQINKILDKLENKYKLLSFDKPGRNQNTQVKLTPPAQSVASSDDIHLPTGYFKYQWHQTLPFPAKVMYLVYLSNSQSSLNSRFSVSRETLSKAYNISESFISDGNGELKKLNLLDIEYSQFENQNFSQRRPNVYTPKDFYDPKDLQTEFKKLTAKHGLDKFQKAMDIAKTVSEENNLKTIQTLIELENQYGSDIMEKAVKVIAEKSIDNPKRSAGYLINTIKSMAKETQVKSQ